MMAFISLPAVLEKIMQDPTYKSGKFGEIKELIMGMLDTYNYELTLLQTTNQLLGRDLHGQYKQQHKYLTRGFQPKTNKCTLCSGSLSTEASGSTRELIIFRCGHLYHHSCLQGSVGFEEELICIHCNKSNAIKTVTYRRTNSRSDKNSKTHVKKSGKRVDFQVNLSQEQQTALNHLWDQGNRSVRKTLMAELVAGHSPDWSSSNRSYSSQYGRSNSSTGAVHDEKFSLRLAPPQVRNNFS